MQKQYERRYTEDEIREGLTLWFGKNQIQTSDPDRYDYLPGMLLAIRVAAGHAPQKDEA